MKRIKCLRDYGFKTDHQTYVVAEIGINHGGNIAIAKDLIDSAARAGADAVKFQTYLTEKRAPPGHRSVFEILKNCELPFEDFEELKEHAALNKIDFFSTPFDLESLQYLESIDCPLYKIASFDVVNHALLREIAKTGKPIILSVGMSNLKEIDEALAVIGERKAGLALLHCISAYPTSEDDANLAALYTLQDHYDWVIGQSDHTNDIRVPLYAVAAGAQIIEKHFKIDEKMDCIDASVSITEGHMRQMVKEIRAIEKVLGNGELGMKEAEKAISAFRRFSD